MVRTPFQILKNIREGTQLPYVDRLHPHRACPRDVLVEVVANVEGLGCWNAQLAKRQLKYSRVWFCHSRIRRSHYDIE